MSTGTIVSWEKNEGDEVMDGDVLAQVETDKATMDMDSATEGYMAKIVVPAGTKDIPLGKVSGQNKFGQLCYPCSSSRESIVSTVAYGGSVI